jgi:hypothetical protein
MSAGELLQKYESEYFELRKRMDHAQAICELRSYDYEIGRRAE